MKIRAIDIRNELHTGSASSGRFLLGDTGETLARLLETEAGKIKLIYLDPPYMTGSRFQMRVRVGEKDWKTLRGSMSVETFRDCAGREEYLGLMRDVLQKCHALLRDDGMLFLHIDYRVHPYMRLMLDEIFGEENFLNEIIWVYQTGGRATHHFSRKHDVILFYAKGPGYDFNIDAVKVVPTEPRNNHMRRHTDPDGRVYRSIRSGGRVYTYYDDDPIAPTDVWNDLPHLQQRDPERTGYDTQKPLSLLERIVKCGSREGETVLDPFAGSGTTLEAAKRCGRNFIGIDRCPLTLNILRRRMRGADYRIDHGEDASSAQCDFSVLAGVGFYHIELTGFAGGEEPTGRSFEGLDRVDSWSVGYLQHGDYVVFTEFLRSKRTPALKTILDLPVYAGTMAACVNDVYGHSYFFEILPE